MTDFRYARLITKSSTGVPTIPPSASHDTGDWDMNDLYEFELYIDEADEKLYTRVGGSIVPLSITSSEMDALLATKENSLPSKAGNALKFLQVKADETGFEWTPVSSGITIGSTAIASGTDTRVLFQNGGVVSESANFTYSGTVLTVGNSVKVKSTGLYPSLDFENSISHTAQIQMYYNQLYFNTGGASSVLDNVGLSLGFGGTGASARLDTKSAGGLSSDILARWRNHTNTANLGKMTGDGAFTWGTYTDTTSAVSFSVTGKATELYVGGGTTQAIYAQNQQGTGTANAITALCRQNSGAYTSRGLNVGADTSGVGSINMGVRAYAYNGETNYAGYFDAVGGTYNYGIYVQRGKVNFQTLPTSSAGLVAGDIWNDAGTLKIV